MLPRKELTIKIRGTTTIPEIFKFSFVNFSRLYVYLLNKVLATYFKRTCAQYKAFMKLKR